MLVVMVSMEIYIQLFSEDAYKLYSILPLDRYMRIFDGYFSLRIFANFDLYIYSRVDIITFFRLEFFFTIQRIFDELGLTSIHSERLQTYP